MRQGLLFQFVNEPFIIRRLPACFRISAFGCVQPVTMCSSCFLVICADRLKLGVTREAAPNLQFALREAGHN